jgi:hypothetical protein
VFLQARTSISEMIKAAPSSVCLTGSDYSRRGRSTSTNDSARIALDNFT